MKVIYPRVKEQDSQILINRLFKVINWMQLRYNKNLDELKLGYVKDQFIKNEFTVRIKLI